MLSLDTELEFEPLERQVGILLFFVSLALFNGRYFQRILANPFSFVIFLVGLLDALV